MSNQDWRDFVKWKMGIDDETLDQLIEDFLT
jgi:hypothetical protein